MTIIEYINLSNYKEKSSNTKYNFVKRSINTTVLPNKIYRLLNLLYLIKLVVKLTCIFKIL